MRTLADGVCHYSVNSNHGQNKSERRKDRKQNCAEARACHGVIHQLIHRTHVSQRKLVVQRPSCGLESGNSLLRSGRTAHDDVHLSSKRRAPAGIEIRNVHRRLIFFAQTLVFHIADDADNRVPVSFGVVFTSLNSYSHWFLIWEITPGHDFVDDKDVRSRGTILLRKKTATKKRDAESGEVVRADGNLGDGRSRLVGCIRLAFDVKRIREYKQVGRQAHGHARRFNSRRILDALKELIVKGNNLRRLRIALSRQSEQCGHEVRGIEARIHRFQLGQTSNQQAGSGQDDKCQGKFGHDQRAVQAARASS